MASTEPVSRTPEWVQREYGRDKWPAIERLIDNAAGAETSLARVVAQVAREDWYQSESPATVQDTVVAGQPVAVSRSVSFGGFHHYVLESALELCEAEPELIIELGSGWGRNLMSLWLAGGPRDAFYIGAEFTEAGRRAAQSLSEFEPALRYRSLPFDYHAPDLSAIEPVDRALVLTVHSIEQIPYLPVEVVETVRGLASNVECLHFEPVGWQTERGSLLGTSSDHAQAHDYNRDLVAVLESQAAAGRIEMLGMQPEVIGAGTPLNATTRIHWRSSR